MVWEPDDLFVDETLHAYFGVEGPDRKAMFVALVTTVGPLIDQLENLVFQAEKALERVEEELALTKAKLLLAEKGAAEADHLRWLNQRLRLNYIELGQKFIRELKKSC